MRRNIILAVISFIGVSIAIVIRKNWNFYWIFLAIMSGFLLIAGIGGFLF